MNFQARRNASTMTSSPPRLPIRLPKTPLKPEEHVVPTSTSRRIQVEVRKKATIVKREHPPTLQSGALAVSAHEEDSAPGKGREDLAAWAPPPCPPLSPSASPSAHESAIESPDQRQGQILSEPVQRRSYTKTAVRPRFDQVHELFVSRRKTLRRLHTDYREANLGKRTYGYSHFCALYLKWLDARSGSADVL
jgi:hypothetical protein